MRIAGLGALTAIVPALFYYGGGWYQPGYRYLVDALPFLMVLAASGARDGLGQGWKLAILASILVTTWSIGVLWGGVRPVG